MADADQNDLTTLTVTLLSSYVANNSVESGSLPALIQSTHGALKALSVEPEVANLEPEYIGKVSVRKSLGSRDHIISMIDGKPYKMLKRHLASHQLTPEQYRERYKLPRDYPMVAATYSEQRRLVAEKLGLGRKVAGARAADATAAAASETSADVPVAAEAKVEKPVKTPRTSAKPEAAPAVEPKAETPVKATRARTTPVKPEATPAREAKPRGRATKAAAAVAKPEASAESAEKPKRGARKAASEPAKAEAPQPSKRAPRAKVKSAEPAQA